MSIHQFKPRIVGTQPPVRKWPDSPRFFCIACNMDDFKLYSDGTVHCANCGSRISNVTTYEKGSK